MSDDLQINVGDAIDGLNIEMTFKNVSVFDTSGMLEFLGVDDIKILQGVLLEVMKRVNRTFEYAFINNQTKLQIQVFIEETLECFISHRYYGSYNY